MRSPEQFLGITYHTTTFNLNFTIHLNLSLFLRLGYIPSVTHEGKGTTESQACTGSNLTLYRCVSGNNPRKIDLYFSVFKIQACAISGKIINWFNTTCM